MKQINKIIYSSSKFIPNIVLCIDEEFLVKSYYVSFYSHDSINYIDIYLSSIDNFKYKNFKINIIEIIKDLLIKYHAASN